jgi:LPXTG-site transpeptidase (sortase) family protein
MNIWLKRILFSLLLLVILAVAINFSFFYANLKFAFLRRPQVLDERFRPAVAGEKNVMEPNYLLVPSLGIQAPVIYSADSSDKGFAEALQNGVVHYPGTANFGQAGNCYIFGHSSDYFWSKGKYKTVFALLPQIKSGEEILVSDPQGNVYRYIVRITKIISPDQTQYLQQDVSKKVLTLQASWPVGTALKRFLAIAELE